MIALIVVVFQVVMWSATEGVGYYPPPVPGYGAYAGYARPVYAPRYPSHHVATVNEYKPRSEDVDKPKDYEQQDAKYYYGGKFQGSCSNDGLYYQDETAFVICSNGYPSDMACPPGTKTAEFPSYQAGFYYGYTDLCSVNLVDLGYGPDTYSASQSASQYNKDSSNNKDKPSYSSSYSDKDSDSYPAAPAKDSIPKNPYASQSDKYPSKPSSYTPVVKPPSYPQKVVVASRTPDYVPSKDTYSNKDNKDAYNKDSTYGGRDSSYSQSGSYPKYPATKPAYQPTNDYHQKTADKPSYASAGSNPYISKDSYSPSSSYVPKEIKSEVLPGYGSSNSYPQADSYLAAKDSGRDDYHKVTFPVKTKYSAGADDVRKH